MSTLRDWLVDHPLTPSEVDCSTTVMLKILDGKCKMTHRDKVVMQALYDAVKHHPGKLFDANIHHFIEFARHNLNETIKSDIYEKRVMAETMLSRPVMKAFKARIRNNGLFERCQLCDTTV